ncbi:HAD family phosphatase [Kutzneria viridogrisea]|uniref:HAD superfamily hydrolase (TIGR01509 family) n=1 Tax=Kutzneria viridogrisea TaxID=47990 RepID=A0ABR6BB75_9PSEU|nr:HAD superfamily hydrolase (TIGR01509 family) [Kutzneria viridogrisea]
MDAVVFDMDGVLVDSERTWDEVRRAVTAEHGGTWAEDTTRAMMGMSTPEWAQYLVTARGVRLDPERVAELVIAGMIRRYDEGPPVLPGAVEAVLAVARRHPVAIASSSPPALIEAVLHATGLSEVVGVALSSEQTGAGKPAPDVYLAAAKALGVDPTGCAAVEDSTNGLRSALNAGMTVYAVPNPHFPPDPAVLAQVHAVLSDIGDLPAALGT